MEEKNNESSVRIQTSILNGVEKKTLIFLADRQPRWMTSNILTGIGTIGAVVISLGYILSQFNINYLWLSSLGFVINWYGDSLHTYRIYDAYSQREHKRAFEERIQVDLRQTWAYGIQGLGDNLQYHLHILSCHD